MPIKEKKPFKVSLEITLDAETPLEAAKTLLSWIKEGDTNFQYYVQAEDEKEIYSVDLDEEDEDAVLPVKEYLPLIDIL
jgi:hypothetical protein